MKRNISLSTISENDILGMQKIASNEGYSLAEFRDALTNPIEFNNGCCVAFAEWFSMKIPNSTIIEVTEYFIENIPSYEIGTFYHVVLKVDNLYYDYEVLNGVKSISEIPFVKRIVDKFNNK